MSAAELVETWKQQFPDFWPEGNQFYGPLTASPRARWPLLNMSLPGKMKLSTGVHGALRRRGVVHADDPEGHMFAGWITFSATEVENETVAQAQVLMRASDPIFELGLTLGGHKQENVFWQETLTNVANRFGHEGDVDTAVVCVDPKRQWRRWRNIWQSSAIRSTFYMFGAPGRAIKRGLTRKR